MLRGLEDGVMLGQLLDPPQPQRGGRRKEQAQEDPLAGLGMPGLFGAVDQNLQALGGNTGGRRSKAGQQENLSRGGGDEVYGSLAAIANDAVGGGASTKMQRGVGPSGMRADRDPSAPRGLNG